MNNSPANQRYVRSVAELSALAVSLAPSLRGGEIIGLQGDLGAGKTELARAIIHALGFCGDVASPTFTLENWYELPNPGVGSINIVSHWDLYRIRTAPEELLEIPVDSGTLVLVEWPEFSAELSQRIQKTIQIFCGSPNEFANLPETCQSLSSEIVSVETLRRIVLQGF